MAPAVSVCLRQSVDFELEDTQNRRGQNGYISDASVCTLASNSQVSEGNKIIFGIRKTSAGIAARKR